jgi:UDP-N-acetylmuramoyl-tripeptide--D-alanyl-D-alanine ligase
MSHPGEIEKNVDIFRPETALITNIGNCHIEYLKTRDNIFKAKSEILTYLREGDTAIVNGDDDYLSKLEGSGYALIKVGLSGCDYTASDIVQSAQGVRFKTTVRGRQEDFSFAIPGEHNVTNCLMAIAVGVKYGMTPDEIRRGLTFFSLSGNRMEIVSVKGITLINDTYNANPEAVKAAIGTLCAMAQARKIAVLGDMYELGAYSEDLHEACGRYAAEQNIDLLLTFGKYGENYYNGFVEGCGRGRCLIFKDQADICGYLKKNLIIGDTVLFKASHSVKLEEAFLSVKGIL